MCAMGRFKLTGNKENIRAAARSTKENAQSSKLKRKEGDSTSPLDSSVPRKRLKTPQGALIKSSRPSALSSMVVESSGGKGKNIVKATDAHRSASSLMRLSSFDKIKKTFTRSSVSEVKGSPSAEQKLASDVVR